MRKAFADEITKIASTRNDVVLLSGDIGNKMFDDFKEIAPNRFFNCGIAEASMTSIASGMALNNLKPIIYTITPFATLRCLEQIKIGIAYHQAPVIIVGTGSGLSYSELGATHHSLDDIAILRAIPDFQILAPCDSFELRVFLNQAIERNKPTYIRIGKKGEPIITNDFKNPEIGKANILSDGNEILILGIGPVIYEAIQAKNEYNKHDDKICIVSMGSVKPLDTKFLKRMSSKGFKKWLILEEHSVIGGLGSSIAEWQAKNNIDTPEIIFLGTPDKFIHNLGSQSYVRGKLGLDKYSIKNFLFQK